MNIGMVHQFTVADHLIYFNFYNKVQNNYSKLITLSNDMHHCIALNHTVET
jgi:hypothetical protein